MLKICQRVVSQGSVREGAVAADIGPDDARALLDSWLVSMGIELRERELLAHLQGEGFSHADLYRRARRVHDRRLREAIGAGTAAVAAGDFSAAVGGLFGALMPAIPYAPPTVFLGTEKTKLSDRGERPRVGLIADGIEAMHGVTRTIEEIRERGVPGFDVEVVGTDPGVDRRLPAAAALEVPARRRPPGRRGAAARVLAGAAQAPRRRRRQGGRRPLLGARPGAAGDRLPACPQRGSRRRRAGPLPGGLRLGGR